MYVCMYTYICIYIYTYVCVYITSVPKSPSRPRGHRDDRDRHVNVVEPRFPEGHAQDLQGQSVNDKGGKGWDETSLRPISGFLYGT